MQIKHVSEIKHSELEPIRKLVEIAIKNTSYGLDPSELRDTEYDIINAVIDLFTIKKNSDGKE